MVMVVSCSPVSVAAKEPLVSTASRGCVPCAKLFALLGLMWVLARKSLPCKPKMGEKRCFQARWASFFAEMPVEGPCWASFIAPTGSAHGLVGSARPPCLQWWGFCTTRSRRTACRRRVGPSCSAIPPAAQCRIRFCVRTGFPSCVDGCVHLLAALQECHRFAGVCAAYPASFVPPDTRPNPGPRRVDHLHHHTPVTLSEHPTTRAANQLVARLSIEHQK